MENLKFLALARGVSPASEESVSLPGEEGLVDAELAR